MDHDEVTRVLLRQPALPHYRLPIFQRLATQPSIDLTLAFSSDSSIANVSPTNLVAIETQYKHIQLPIIGPTYSDPDFKKLIQSSQPHVAIFPWNARQTDMGHLLRYCHKQGIGTVVWGHGYSKSDSGIRMALRDRIGGLANAVLCYSQVATEQLKAGRLDPNKVFTAANCLDQTENIRAYDHWQSQPQKLKAFQTDHHLADRPVIGFVSRLNLNNRLDLLLEAMPNVLKAHPDAMAVIIGKGDAEREKLTAHAKELRIEQSVLFNGPIYDPIEVGAYFKSFDIFCYPENIGLSILHAFAFGVPVVTSDNPSIQNPEFVTLKDGINGATYEHGNTTSLSQTINKLLSDTAALHEMSLQAYATAHEEYTPQNMINGFIDAIRFAKHMAASKN